MSHYSSHNSRAVDGSEKTETFLNEDLDTLPI